MAPTPALLTFWDELPTVLAVSWRCGGGRRHGAAREETGANDVLVSDLCLPQTAFVK
jgi:hypothetical protein